MIGCCRFIKKPRANPGLLRCHERRGLRGILVSDFEAVDVADGLASVVRVAVDEVAGDGLVAIGIPGDILFGDLPFFEEELGCLKINLGLVNFLGGVEIPFLGLGFRDLTPAAHLREEPDSVGIPRVGALVFEEDIELGHLALVRFLEEEKAGHGVLNDVEISTDIIGTGEDLCGLHAVYETARGVCFIEPLTGKDEGFGDGDIGLGIFVSPLFGDSENFLGIVLPDVVICGDGNSDTHRDGGLVPGLTDTVALDIPSLESLGHHGWRGDGEFDLGIGASANVGLGIHTGVDA